MADSSSDVAQEQQRRADNLQQLRHFLLTSNAEQRAGRRDKQNFLKRKLVGKQKEERERKPTHFLFRRFVNIFDQ